MAAGRKAVTLAAIAAGTCGWLRPRLLTWGASGDEIARTYPTDDLVPDPDPAFTMATTLPAPPEEVWPWLAQMGGDRAGWYSFDRLDHWGVPSADRIVAEWQHPEVGDRLQNAPDGRNWMTVADVVPNHVLALRTTMAFPSRRSFDPSGPLPRVYVDGVWTFDVRPAGDGRSRLVARMRGRCHPKPLLRPFLLVVGDPVHFAMQLRQFHNLRRRVSVPVSGATGDADALARERHLALTTFKRDGTPVSTPVWCAERGGTLLVLSEAGSWKVKRIRRDPHVQVAPSSARGRQRGPAVDADAAIAEDTAEVEALLARKYGWLWRAYRELTRANERLHHRPPPESVAIEIGLR